MDKLTKEQRRKNMQAVHSRDTKIELTLRKALWHKGLRYRKNYTKLEGHPDIVFIKKRVAIFCDSEFWHGYDWDNKRQEIKSNRKFWVKKIESNMKRDNFVNETLREKGWTVLRFWGIEISDKLDECIATVECILSQSSATLGLNS